MKTTTKVYDQNSNKELNGDFGTAGHDNESGNENKEHIPRAKGKPIYKNNNNKPSNPTVRRTS